jgi:hypothetical protein
MLHKTKLYRRLSVTGFYFRKYKMKKIILSCVLLLVSFISSADTLTIDSQGIATFVQTIPAVNAGQTKSRLFKLQCPSTYNGVNVIGTVTVVDTSNFSNDWIATTNNFNYSYKQKPVNKLNITPYYQTTISLPVSYFSIARYGLVNQSLTATVTSTIGCYAGSTIVPIAPIIAPLSNLNGYIQPIN